MKQRSFFKPILFSTPMVSAILPKRKKQTRREIKSKSPEMTALMINILAGVDVEKNKAELLNNYSPYQIGDVLWVREAWNFSDDLSEPYLYRQQHEEDYLPEYHSMAKWKPSIHMSKEAARIFLKVTDVRIEELHDITEADAIAEGIDRKKHTGGGIDGWKNYLKQTGLYDMPRNSFRSLWQSINGNESWERNPLVWVISFEVIDQPKIYTFNDLEFKPHEGFEGLSYEGKHATKIFANGYGVSVVRFKISSGRYGSYTNNEEQWELAIIYGSIDNYSITYNTPIANDVLGYLSEKEVTDIMYRVQGLK